MFRSISLVDSPQNHKESLHASESQVLSSLESSLNQMASCIPYTLVFHRFP